MNNYYSLSFRLTPCSEDATDLLAAFLADAGAESFEPSQTGLTAYIKEELYSADAINECIADFPFPCQIDYDATLIEGEDWNSEWEKNYFQPILIDDKVVIRSSFHKDAPKAEYEILIDPKMAFGTGHHATTSMMVHRILEADMKDATVIDMGTGTGILAILCTMRGAKVAYGIEIDEMAFENTLENGRLNSSPAQFICGDASALEALPQADLFLANINRNVITADIAAYAAHIRPGGMLFLSGFYEPDVAIIEAAAAPHGLRLAHTMLQGEWCSLAMRKS